MDSRGKKIENFKVENNETTTINNKSSSCSETISKNSTSSYINDVTSELKILDTLTANNKPLTDNKVTLVTGENEYYSLDFKFTGLAVMINNYKFTNERLNFPDQIAHKDSENFETLKKFNFNTNYYLNQKKFQIDHLIQYYASFDYSDYACLFFCMSSHGKQHTIMSSDCSDMDIYEDIIELFNQVESLKNKPKIFIFDCCRGRETMYKGDVGDVDINQNKPMRKEKEWKFADLSNFFFAYSTVINFVSELSLRRGSHFISAFFEVLDAHGNTEDWDELQRKVSKLMNERHKQVPEFVIRPQLKLAFVKLEKKDSSSSSSSMQNIDQLQQQLQHQLQLQQKQQLEHQLKLEEEQRKFLQEKNEQLQQQLQLQQKQQLEHQQKLEEEQRKFQEEQRKYQEELMRQLTLQQQQQPIVSVIFILFKLYWFVKPIL
jgi:hypothetical protein